MTPQLMLASGNSNAFITLGIPLGIAALLLLFCNVGRQRFYDINGLIGTRDRGDCGRDQN